MNKGFQRVIITKPPRGFCTLLKALFWAGNPMAEEGYRRKHTAVMSADVACYSRLMSEDESATVKTLATYRKIMPSLIKQYRGKVVDSPGDNVLAVLIVKGMVFTFKDGLKVVSVGIGIRMVYVYESILIGAAVSILYLIENLTVSLFS